jgi:hypothetical protein
VKLNYDSKKRRFHMPTDTSGRFTALLDSAFKKEIDDCIMEKKIKNFQDAYRKIVKLGYEQFKKGKEV